MPMRGRRYEPLGGRGFVQRGRLDSHRLEQANRRTDRNEGAPRRERCGVELHGSSSIFGATTSPKQRERERRRALADRHNGGEVRLLPVDTPAIWPTGSPRRGTKAVQPSILQEDGRPRFASRSPCRRVNGRGRRATRCAYRSHAHRCQEMVGKSTRGLGWFEENIRGGHDGPLPWSSCLP